MIVPAICIPASEACNTKNQSYAIACEMCVRKLHQIDDTTQGYPLRYRVDCCNKMIDGLCGGVCTDFGT